MKIFDTLLYFPFMNSLRKKPILMVLKSCDSKYRARRIENMNNIPLFRRRLSQDVYMILKLHNNINPPKEGFLLINN